MHKKKEMASTKREREDEENNEAGAKEARTQEKGVQLKKIISGGQTGADQAALRAAQHVGLSTGGWAPRGFFTSNGPDPTLGTKYCLQEIELDAKTPRVADYVARSKKNVDDSDATLAFRLRFSAGTDKTIGYCVTRKWTTIYDRFAFSRGLIDQHRPVLVLSHAVSLDKHQNEIVRQRDIKELREFLIEHNVQTLNVAGHRDDPLDPTWEKRVFDFLVAALSDLK